MEMPGHWRKLLLAAFVAALMTIGTGCSESGSSQVDHELSARVTELESAITQQQATIDERDTALEDATQQLAMAKQQIADLEEQLREAEAAVGEATAREQELRGVLDDNVAAIDAERDAFLRELAQLRETARLPDTPQVRGAVAALTGFLSAMRSGRYDDAAVLYAGSYEVLHDWNPTVDPSDHEALLEAACDLQLLCGLEVERVLPGLVDADEYGFYLEFTQDGEPFSLGPCCGDDSTEPQTQFPFQVISTDDGYKVLTLPVYVP
jgi:uncharacterized coiled-coil protein SlyX